MAQSAPARTKINTKVTQPSPGRPSRRPAGRPGPGRPPKGSRVSGDARGSVRQPARPVIELDFGILVYPPEADGEPWRGGVADRVELGGDAAAREDRVPGDLPGSGVGPFVAACPGLV